MLRPSGASPTTLNRADELRNALFSHPDFRPEDFGIGVLFDSVRDGVIIGDATTERIVLWNTAAEMIFGYSAAEALEMPLHAIVPPEFQAQHRRGLVHYYETGQGLLIDSHAPLDLPAVRKDGSRVHVELTLTPVKEAPEASRYILAIVRDVTARKEMEEELHSYHAHLQEGLERERAASRRLTELDELRNDFVSMVVHDLRNPLSAIQGLTKTLQTRWDKLTDHDRGSLLDSMRSSTTNLAQLIDEVFLIARIEGGNFSYDIRPFDLAVVVRRSIQEQEAAHDGLVIRTDIPADLPAAMGDQRRQGRILNNLLSNAIKFSPEKSPVEVGAAHLDHALLVSVRDSGPGIDQADHVKLFERFVKLRQPGAGKLNGTGLGLFICKQMVEAQGGRIEVDSEPGTGSTFSYTVPLAPPPTAQMH
jgi:PAS domain S-box-containing protein